MGYLAVRYYRESNKDERILIQRSPTQNTLDLGSRSEVLFEGWISRCIVPFFTFLFIFTIIIVEECCFVEQEIGKNDQSCVSVHHR